MELQQLNKVVFIDKETVITADFLNQLQEVIEAHHEAIIVSTEAVEGKAERVHVHQIANIEGLEAQLATLATIEEVANIRKVLEGYARKEHRHNVSEIDGLEARLEEYVTSDELSDFLTAEDLTGLQNDVSSVKGKIDAKADKSHNHALADVGGLSTALSEFVTNSALTEQLGVKADKTHNHSILNVEGLGDALGERYTKAEVDGLLTEIEVDLSPVETKIEEVAGDVATLKEASTSHNEKIGTLESDVEELTAIVTEFNVVEIDDSQETAATVWSSAKTKQEIENAVQSVDVTIENATTEVAGLMSAEDKKKLDGIDPAEMTEVKEDVELLREASATQAQSLETVKTTAESAKTVANDVKAKVEGMSAKLDKIDETAPRIYAQSTAPINAVVGTIWIKTN